MPEAAPDKIGGVRLTNVIKNRAGPENRAGDGAPYPGELRSGAKGHGRGRTASTR